MADAALNNYDAVPYESFPFDAERLKDGSRDQSLSSDRQMVLALVTSQAGQWGQPPIVVADLGDNHYRAIDVR